VLYSSGHYDTDFRNYFENGFVSELTKLESATVVNAQVTYRLNNLVELYLRGENIFNADYEEVLSYRTPGAVALIGMRLSL
jgi:vitamin B12 transporter